MSWRPLHLLLAAVPAAALLLAVQYSTGDGSADLAEVYERDCRPILVKHCNQCHGRDETQGNLNLAILDSGEKAIEANIWETVIQRLRLGEMPPQDQPRLSEPELAELLAWSEGVAASDGRCNTIATDATHEIYRGPVMSRRLTRAEYNRTMRDLLGLDTHPADAFPADGAAGEGFDTDGNALFTNPILFEKYVSAADRLIETALADSAAGLAPPAMAARERILNVAPELDPARGVRFAPRERARRILLALARRAYRRPVDEQDIGPLLKLYERAEARGDAFLPALRLAAKGVLVSPNFLFLVEPEPAKSGVHQLGPWPLASRLSYFLWGSMPDDRLFALAESGWLADRAVLRAQTRRMLKDPRSLGLAESFATQWLGIGALGESARPDAAKFPEFDDELAAAMKGETVAMLDYVLRNDRSLLELLDADYTLLNERLARHYGISGVAGAEFRPISLADPNRGGLLGMAGVLTATSLPLRTSPTLRGKWVLAELLGGKTPPPPPNVPSLPEDDDARDGLTLRAQLERHRASPECNSCHSRMDPLGFGLENFDPLGRWRSETAGEPVDASGQLPGGERFRGPAELKRLLLERRTGFLKNSSRKLLGYALGRELNRFDACVVEGAVKALEAHDYRASILIEHIVLSYPFSHRFVKK